MSIRSETKLLCESVVDVHRSNYEFNKFDKTLLNEKTSALKMFVTSEANNDWKKAVGLIYNAINIKYSDSGRSIYCFITSPFWKNDTPVARHLGLNRALNDNARELSLEYILESEIVNNNEVLFYGVIELNPNNARSIFSLLSKYENGILFSSQGPNDSYFNSIVNDLSILASEKTKSSTVILNMVFAINTILNYRSEALFPYAWEETGDYGLDIFGAEI